MLLNPFVFILLWFISFSAPASTGSDCAELNDVPPSEQQRRILVEFYELTSLSSPWRDSEGWLSACSSHCKWFGVGCDSNGLVKKLILRNNRLSGELPPILGKLWSLIELDLSENSLHGSLDQAQFTFPDLRILNLSSNWFTQISESTFVYQSRSLKVLDLSRNSLNALPESFVTDLGDHLQILLLRSNQLQKLPLNFGKMKLKELGLDGNTELIIGSELWDLSKLQGLSLRGVNLQGKLTSPSLSKLERLVVLSVSDTGLSEFPPEVLHLQRLGVLWMDQNPIRSIPPEINSMPALQRFGCDSCGLSSLPEFDLPSLRVLSLSFNSVPFINISLLPSLEWLVVSCSQIYPSSLSDFNLRTVQFESQDFRSVPQLPPSVTRLNLLETGVSSLPSNPLPNLEILQVYFQFATLGIPSNLSDLYPLLRVLSLEGEIAGTIPPLPLGLESLTLGGKKISGTIPSSISKCSNLRSLQIRNSFELKGTVPTEILLLTHLQHLKISNTSVSPFLSSELKGLDVEECVFETAVNGSTFECESELIVGEENICNVKCDSPHNLEGVWINDFQSEFFCEHSRSGFEWSRSKLEIKRDGSITSLVEFREGCDGEPVSAIMLEGFVVLNNTFRLGAETFQTDVEFHVTNQSVILYSASAITYFQIFCRLALKLGQWQDMTTTPCVTNNLGVRLEFFDLIKCPVRFDTWFVNFQNSSLMTGGGVFLGLEPASNCDLRGELALKTEPQWRRDWKCSESKELESCEPDCGDGFKFGKEQCDDGNNQNMDGCLSDCSIQRGWDCSLDSNSHSICTIDCEEVADQFGCPSSNSSGVPFWYWLIGAILFVACISMLLLRRARKSSKILTINAEELKLIELLGEGHFGKVFKGVWRGTTEVAVKVLKREGLSKEEIEDFFQEAKLLMSVPPHPNIVQFLGVSFGTRLKDSQQISGTNEENIDHNIKIVTEYLGAGSLIHFLQSSYSCGSGDQMAKGLSYSLILQLGKGISAGMDHLHKNNIVHRDLAARNILIHSAQKGIHSDDGTQDQEHSQLTPKISDFGLAGKGKRTKIPVRWSPPEVLQDSRLANEKTDVWSFGVLMYEICVGGNFLPYWTLDTNQEVREFILRGGQLKIPEEVPVECSALIKGCLSFLDFLRPTFWAINDNLNSLQSSLGIPKQVHETIEDLDSPRVEPIVYETAARSRDAQKPGSSSVYEGVVLSEP